MLSIIRKRKALNIIAEIGINYAYGKSTSGFIDNAKRLIDISAVAGCSHVKFQKRNPAIAVPENKKKDLKVVPWREGAISYLQYKYDIEFNINELEILFNYAVSRNIIPFSSAWDINSAELMSSLSNIVKIPSAKLTNDALLKVSRENFKFRILSTGMSTEEEIERAVNILNPQVILHTNSTYPTPVEDLNMGYIKHLQKKFPNKEIGFSNHAYGIEPIIASTVLGINWIEFHITENHNYWGSDQASSVEPVGVFKLIKGIRDIGLAFNKGDGDRVLFSGEDKKKESLRG